MTKVTNVNKPVGNQDNYEAVTTHRAWRHTIGRLSNLARIPIYGLATVFQAAKILIKLPFTAFVSAGRWLFDSEKLSSWAFEGVAKDAIMIGSLVDRTLNSALCVLCAPPKQNHSFWEAIKIAGKITIGEYNQHDKTVADLFAFATQGRAQYHKQIFQCECIAADGFVSPKLKSRIKAG